MNAIVAQVQAQAQESAAPIQLATAACCCPECCADESCATTEPPCC